MEAIFTDANIGLFIQLLVALALGMLVGAERSIAGKTAGMRTYGLVAMGSALFMAVALTLTAQLSGVADLDPLRSVAGVATGIGFIGAGIILFRGKKLTGLTTAAGLWVSAGIGVAVGAELYTLAVSATVLTLIAFTAFWFVEAKVVDIADDLDGD